ncbi:hypothetical protein N7470_007944 [Penicillium chermesinum]|nr:hypothetical protein N7470_007944 [Penicillium chermesinum]
MPGTVCTPTLNNWCNILSYGLPCDAILSTALDPLTQDVSRGTKLPSSMKASDLIPNPSVLVSQLESVSKSSQAISRKLDHMLDNVTTANSTKPSDSSNFDHLDLADWAIYFGLGTMSDEGNVFEDTGNFTPICS